VGNINFPLPPDGGGKGGGDLAKQLEGLKFRRQEPIGKYIADFACHEKRITLPLIPSHQGRGK
jgi:hypothetical protein